MERILCLAVGYLFGLFQTGYIYSKLHHVDIRKEGSGNAGSTNVLRVMGVKAGGTAFLPESAGDGESSGIIHGVWCDPGA